MISRRSLTWTSRPRLQKRTMSMRSLVIGATLLFAGCAGMQMATTEASAQNACEPTITSTTEPCGGPLVRSVAVVTNNCSCNVDAYLTYKGPGGTAVVTNVPLGGGTRSHKSDCRLEPITFSLARSSFHCPRNTKVAPLSKNRSLCNGVLHLRRNKEKWHPHRKGPPLLRKIRSLIHRVVQMRSDSKDFLHALLRSFRNSKHNTQFAERWSEGGPLRRK